MVQNGAKWCKMVQNVIYKINNFVLNMWPFCLRDCRKPYQ
jgi:hypothetical protein